MNKNKLQEFKKNSNFEELTDWCLTVIDYIESTIYRDPIMIPYLRDYIEKAKTTKSMWIMRQIYSGLCEQVRETFSPLQMKQMDEILSKKFGCNMTDIINNDTAKIQKIIKRGKIRSDKEFEMIKLREEEIYEDESQKKLCRSYA